MSCRLLILWRPVFQGFGATKEIHFPSLCHTVSRDCFFGVGRRGFGRVSAGSWCLALRLTGESRHRPVHITAAGLQVCAGAPGTEHCVGVCTSHVAVC